MILFPHHRALCALMTTCVFNIRKSLLGAKSSLKISRENRFPSTRLGRHCVSDTCSCLQNNEAFCVLKTAFFFLSKTKFFLCIKHGKRQYFKLHSPEAQLSQMHTLTWHLQHLWLSVPVLCWCLHLLRDHSHPSYISFSLCPWVNPLILCLLGAALGGAGLTMTLQSPVSHLSLLQLSPLASIPCSLPYGHEVRVGDQGTKCRDAALISPEIKCLLTASSWCTSYTQTSYISDVQRAHVLRQTHYDQLSRLASKSASTEH